MPIRTYYILTVFLQRLRDWSTGCTERRLEPIKAGEEGICYFRKIQGNVQEVNMDVAFSVLELEGTFARKHIKYPRLSSRIVVLVLLFVYHILPCSATPRVNYIYQIDMLLIQHKAV
jgi:hypothetical protein